MATPHSSRFAARDQGRRRIRRVTGWTSAAAVLISAVFGVVFARSAEATATSDPAVQDNPAPATPGDDGWTDDNGSTVAPPDQPLQPPQAPPAPTNGKHHNATSGGS